MSSIVASLPPVTYAIWLVDYMAFSQLLAAGALAQIGILFYVVFKEKSLIQFLSSVSKCKLPKLLDEDGWEINELLAEAKKVKIMVQSIVNEEEFKHASNQNDGHLIGKATGKAKEIVSKELRIRGTSLDRGSSLLDGSIEDLQPKEAGKPKEVGIEDALIIVRVSNVFKEADTDHSGMIDIVELKDILRKFGKFYSKHEICILVEKFKRAHGSSLVEDRQLDLKSFFRLLIDLEKFAPAELPALKKLNDKSPSYILDVYTRIIYPVLWVVRTVIMLSIVTAYVKK